jgi:Cytochrome P450
MYKNDTQMQQQCRMMTMAATAEDPSSSSSWQALQGGTNCSSNNSSTLTATRGILPLQYQHHHPHPLHCTTFFHNPLVHHVLVVLAVSVGSTLLLLLIAVIKRRATRHRLEKCGLPTVYWRPRFVNYDQPISSSSSSSSSFDNDESETTHNETKKPLSSSNITNILPRMQRLNGPFGMYGTVYGLSTAVVHIAHPIPAAAVLSCLTSASTSSASTSTSTPAASNSATSSSNTTSGSSSSSNSRRSSLTVSSSCGASKAPAYNHFKNFCGNGVFTADGTDWREKRAAVLHALLRPSTSNNHVGSKNTSGTTSNPFETKLQAELAITARCLIDSIESAQPQQHDHMMNEKNCLVQHLNIVPVLQRATIGLIFRYITDSDPVDIFSSSQAAASPNSDGNSSPITSTNKSTNVSNSSSCNTRDDATSAATVATDVDSASTSSSIHSTADQNQQTQSPSLSCCEPTVVHNNNSSSSLGSRSSILQPYLQSITDIRMIILAQSRSIWFLLPRWCYTTFSNMYKVEEETLVPIRQFAQLACQCAMPGSPLHMLQALPKYSSSSSSSSSSSAAATATTAPSSTTSPFSKNLLDEATTLLFAGQDTSAATMSWTLHLLSLHPQIQDQVAAEVQVVLGKNIRHDCNSDNSSGYHNSGNAATRSEEDLGINKKVLAKMPYLDAVVKEAMRLYPVAPFVVRKLPFDVTVVDSDNSKDVDDKSSSSSKRRKTTVTTLPAGTFACIWIYSLHRNPEFWQKPDTFWPERWLVSSSSPQRQQDNDDNDKDVQQPPVLDKGITNGAFMPFAVGPRNCVGQPLAYMILRTLLARLLQRFEFRDARCMRDSSSVDDGPNAGHSTSTRPSSSWSVNNPEAYLKDMQAGFTVLPQNGVTLAIYKRGEAGTV